MFVHITYECGIFVGCDCKHLIKYTVPKLRETKHTNISIYLPLLGLYISNFFPNPDRIQVILQ